MTPHNMHNSDDDSAEGVGIIGPKTLISLGAAIGIVITIAGASWKIGAYMEQINNQLVSIRRENQMNWSHTDMALWAADFRTLNPTVKVPTVSPAGRIEGWQHD